MLRKALCVLVLPVVLLCSCIGKSKPNSKAEGAATMQVTSSAFEEGEIIPRQYTCDGKNISPSIAWKGAPAATKSFALICDDPDAPVGTWVHWVIFGLPADAEDLPENVVTQKTLPDGAKQGINDFHKIGYAGPCPPSGTHRYFFKLYALDAELDLAPGATKAQVESAMQGHILGQGQLMGRYSRKG